MIIKDTILSSFDHKETLLQWLKKVEQALKDDTLINITVQQPTETTAVFTFNFEGGESISTPQITLPRGAMGATGEQGERGERGEQGERGTTALTFAVGDTVTGQAGTQASVVNVGTDEDIVLKFTIPRGDKGERGEQGATGEQGEPGRDGVDGTNGITPKIEIGTVTTLAPGEEATVTDTGTPTYAHFNFGIPRGATGQNGRDGTQVRANPEEEPLEPLRKIDIDGAVYSIPSGEGGVDYTIDSLQLLNEINTLVSFSTGIEISAISTIMYNNGEALNANTQLVLPIEGSDTISVDINESGNKIIFKLDEQAKESTPTEGSTKLLTSGGAYTALSGKLNSTRDAVQTVGGLVKPLTTPTATELVGISTGMEQERVKIGDGLSYDTTTKTLTATGGGGTGGTKLYRHELKELMNETTFVTIISLNQIRYTTPNEIMDDFKNILSITYDGYTVVLASTRTLIVFDGTGGVTQLILQPFNDTVTPL